MEQSKVQVCGQNGFSMCMRSVCKALIPPAPFGCWAPLSASAALESACPWSDRVGRGYTQEAAILISPVPFVSTEHAAARSGSDAMHGNTCKPLCERRSSEAGAVFEARWDQRSQSCKNPKWGKPSEGWLGSLAIKVDLWAFVSGWATGYGKERDLRFLSTTRLLSQTLSSATGSSFLQTLRKTSLTLRDTMAETLFIGIAHTGGTSPPAVKAGEQPKTYNQGLKKLSVAGTWLQGTVHWLQAKIPPDQKSELVLFKL